MENEIHIVRAGASEFRRGVKVLKAAGLRGLGG